MPLKLDRTPKSGHSNQRFFTYLVLKAQILFGNLQQALMRDKLYIFLVRIKLHGNTMTESITARFSNTDIKAIDSLIKAGFYTTRSDFLKVAARNLLREDVPIIPDLIIGMQQQAKKRGITQGKMLKELRKVRRELYDE